MWNNFDVKPAQIGALIKTSPTVDLQLLGFSADDTDPLREINQAVKDKSKYLGSESSLYHPEGGQMVKLKDDGSIDIFADKDNGIRIDPNADSFNVFSNHYKAHIHHYTGWVSGDYKQKIDGDFMQHASGKSGMSAGGNMSFVTKRNLEEKISGNRISSITGNEEVIVNGKRDIKIVGDVNLVIDGNAFVNVGGNATMKVKNLLKAEAGTIDLKSLGAVTIEGTKVSVIGSNELELKTKGTLTMDAAKTNSIKS